MIPLRVSSGAIAAVVVGAASMCVNISPCSAVSIEALGQNRGVSSLVIVPHCKGKAFDSDNAPDFAPYEAVAESERICSLAGALSRADQHSAIGDSALTGSGTAYSEASAGVSDTIHAISNSSYNVSFRLPGRSIARLHAELSAAETENVVYSSASISIRRPNGGVVQQHLVTPGKGGKRNTEILEETLELPAGEYSFRADASAILDTTIPPNGLGDASFEFTMSFRRVGDVDGDCIVNVRDLLAVINAWGACAEPCPPSCDADMAPSGTGGGVGDCSVDVNDLVAVINNWG